MVYPVSSHIIKRPMQTLVLDGTEQTMCIVSGSKREIQAYIDLSEILATDVVHVRTYLRQYPSEAYVRWGDVIYPDPTILDVTKPMMYVRGMPVADSLKLTIEQTAGVLRTIKYSVYERRNP